MVSAVHQKGNQFHIIDGMQGTDEPERLITSQEILSFVDPEMESLAQLANELELELTRFLAKPELLAQRDEYEKKKAAAMGLDLSTYRDKTTYVPGIYTLMQPLVLDNFIGQLRKVGGDPFAIATFEQMREYGDRSYLYVEDDLIGNKCVKSLLSPENKIFLNDKGDPVSLIELLNNRFSKIGVTLTYSVVTTSPERRAFDFNTVKTSLYTDRDLGFFVSSIDKKLAYIKSEEPVPTLTINYHNDGKAYSTSLPIYGSPLYESKAGGVFIMEEMDGNMLICLPVDGKTLLLGPSTLVHEVSHAITYVLHRALELSTRTPGQDYKSLLNEGKAMLEENLFHRTQSMGWSLMKLEDSANANLFGSYHELSKLIAFADHFIKTKNEGKNNTEREIYKYFTGYLIALACQRKFPDLYLSLMYEDANLDVARKIDLENAIIAIHSRLVELDKAKVL